MAERMALLLENREGNTYAVICNSRDAAERIAAVSPDEQVGLVPIEPRSTGILGMGREVTR